MVRGSLLSLQKKLVERAKQMTEDGTADRSGQKEALQQEFEQLLNIFFTGQQLTAAVVAQQQGHTYSCTE